MRRITAAAAGVLGVLMATPVQAQSGDAWGQNGFIGFNGLYQNRVVRFDDQATFRVENEDGSLRSSHEVKPGPAFDVSAGGRLAGGFGIGFGFSYHRRNGVAAVDASVPHPFYFDRPRQVAGSAPDLAREERALHVAAMWLLPLSEKLNVVVFGGPSYVNVKQTLVTNIQYTEQFPFDSADFVRADTEERSEWGLGYNAGVDLTYYMTDVMGIGGIVRFSKATIDLPGTAGATVRTEAGGTQVGAGLRFKF
jgi:hypothetical protein